MAAGGEVFAGPVEGKVAPGAELIDGADDFAVNGDLGEPGVVVTVAEPADAGALEAAFGGGADDVREAESAGVLPIRAESDLPVGNAVGLRGVEIEEVGLAYGQNTPPNRNCPPVLKLRTCVEGLFPLVDSSLPPRGVKLSRRRASPAGNCH